MTEPSQQNEKLTYCCRSSARSTSRRPRCCAASGFVAACGVMLSYVILMTFVPAALTYFKLPRDAKSEEPARAAAGSRRSW